MYIIYSPFFSPVPPTVSTTLVPAKLFFKTDNESDSLRGCLEQDDHLLEVTDLLIVNSGVDM